MTRLFFLLLVYLNIYSQELSPIQSFKVDDYNASGQNWMISQSSNGNLYFANNDGLLKYNGNKWSLYPSPKGTIIRSVNYINDKVTLEKILILVIGLKIRMVATPILQYL